MTGIESPRWLARRDGAVTDADLREVVSGRTQSDLIPDPILRRG